MSTLFSIIQRIKNWLQITVSFSENKKDKWLFIAFCSIFTFAFLLIFQPFGVNNYDPTEQIDAVFFFAVLLFGIATGLTLALNEFVIRPLLFKLKTRGHLLLWISWTFLLLSITIFLLYNYLGNFHDWTFKSYLTFIRDIAYMMILPFLIIYFYLSYRHMKSQYLEVVPAAGRLSDDLLHFVAENGKESFSVQSEQLLYIEAQENYIAIYSIQEGVIKKSLLRNSLKRLEQEFPETLLLRCHRSFMVNVHQISQIKARYRQLTLLLRAGQVEIPVSRKYQQIVKSKLTTGHSSPRAANHP